MKPLIQCKTTILPRLIAGVLVCFAILPIARAVVPAPDGGYPGGNTAEGQNALLSLTTGGFNTALGWLSLRALTTGSYNTGVGAGTLVLNSGDENTATGTGALLLNTTGAQNTATGAFALFSNTEGIFNTATGDRALFSNTTGVSNTAHGIQALFSNTTGNGNTANGNLALYSNTEGDGNTANGNSALAFNTSASFNTAIGTQALFRNTTGEGNAATGYLALANNTEGVANTANGFNALASNTTGSHNTAIGRQALFNNTTGSVNTAVGDGAGADLTGSGNVCIGQGVSGLAGESETTRIRNVYSSVANGRAVYVNNDAKIGTLASSRRFKEEIEPMDKASEVLFALKPVSFRYKKQFDAGRAPMFGLIAEDVEQVDSDLVSRNEKGEVETVRYEQINAMLLNEFLKEHRKVEKLESIITKLTARLDEQDSKIEKVSAQVAVSKPAPQMVVNNQ